MSTINKYWAVFVANLIAFTVFTSTAALCAYIEHGGWGIFFALIGFINLLFVDASYQCIREYNND
jgi:hypothetical protein